MNVLRTRTHIEVRRMAFKNDTDNLQDVILLFLCVTNLKCERLHDFHVTGDTYLGEDGIDECSEMQIIREKFGVMENCLYLCGIVNLV